MRNKRIFSIFSSLDLYRLFWILLFLIQIFSVIFLIINRNFNIDEFESIHSGWKILNGETIYEDFIQQKNPTLYFLLAIIIYFFGESVDSIIASSYLIFIFSAGIIIYSYLLAKLIFNNNTALLSILLLPLIPWFAQSGFEIRPDVPMICFCMASIYHLYKYFDKQNIIHLIFSAVFLSISYIFLQKAIFWFIYFGAILFNRYIVSYISIRNIALYIITIISIYLLFLIILSFHTQLSSYFFFTYKFVHARQTILGGPGNITKIIDEIVQSRALILIILPLFFIGMLTTNLNRSQTEIGLGALWLLSTVFTVVDPGARYFLPAMPLVTIIISHLLSQILNRNKILALIFISGLVFIFSINFQNLINANNLPGKFDDRKRQFSRINYVLNNTDKNDYVYDGIARFNLFRKDLDFIWLAGDRYTHQSVILNKLIPYQYNIYDLINIKDPIVRYYFWIFYIN